MVTQCRRILFVLTSHDTLGDSTTPTGFHYEELAAPYWVFTDAGYEVELASIAGGHPAHDPSSLADDSAERPGSVARFLADPAACRKLEVTAAIADVGADAYDAVFLVGGHGTMWDFPQNEALGGLVMQLHESGRVVGAVCHGPAGLIAARRNDGTPVVQGVRLNSFTDEEEQRVGLADTVPFLLESRLKELGARFEKSSPFRGCAVHDQGFVTGQNPRSSRAVAERMLAVMGDRRREDAA